MIKALQSMGIIYDRLLSQQSLISVFVFATKVLEAEVFDFQLEASS